VFGLSDADPYGYVSDVMTSDPLVTITPYTSVKAALDLLAVSPFTGKRRNRP
jgi:CBS domain-containing protein